MAIGGGDGSITLTTKVDESGLKKGFGSIKKFGATVGKAFLAIGAAAATATVAVTKMATDAYADYEQLVGGVETLFKDSAGKVLEYANQAFATTGQSANEYMQNVTSFSASLLSAVGGDTERAADVANAAMISISDNVNKMGSSAESVQMAFQGFAKQQYMLLDNLKLGYGGTKTEMERLLKDAQAITGVEYNIDNLADVYTAIGVIQEKLGIAGTTAREAESTISGSASMMKAAWQNTLSAIAGGGDLDRAINNLVYSVQKYFENIVPVVERSLVGVGKLIEQVAPLLVQNVASALIKAIPNLVNAVYEMVIGLGKGIIDGVASLFSGSSGNVVAEIQKGTTEAVASTSEASKSVEDLGDATEKAGKKAKKSLAGFDELNVFTQDADDASEEMVDAVAKMSGIEGGGGLSLQPEVDAKPIQGFFGKILKALKPVIDVTQQWFKTLDFEPIKQGFVSLLTPLETIGLFFQDVLFWAYTEILLPLSTWTINEYLPTLLEGWRQGFEAIVLILQPLWEGLKSLFEDAEPIFTWIGDTAIEVIEKLGNTFSDIGKVFTEKGDKIKEIFNTIGEAANAVWVIVEPIFSWIKDIVLDVFGTIDDIVGEAIDMFYNFTQFLGFVFKGDWENAWNSIVGVFKNIANILIDALNVLVRGINKIKFDVPDWVPGIGGQKWGFNIPEIPRLAQGTVVPPNKQFMAMLGDNTREHEIVSPISTMKQAVAEVLAQANIGGGFNGTIEVPVNIDGREIARAVRQAENTLGTQTVKGAFADAY